MLYHVPSGSKSLGSGFSTGCVFRKADRSAIIVVVPSAFTRSTALSVPASPCEQPAPAKIAYSVLPINATSATPLTKLPVAGEVWLEGKLSATVVRIPSGVILEIRDVKSPVYGPTGGTTWSHNPILDNVPPAPPSATYTFPSGPNFSPRGLFNPSKTTETFADCDHAEHASSRTVRAQCIFAILKNRFIA